MKLLPILTATAAALALAACGSGNGETGATSGEKIETIAAPAGQAWSDNVRKTEAGGYVMGNPDAPIKLIEFMSLTCSHCAEFGETAFDAIKTQYVDSGRVSFEVRNYVRDPIDLTMAILSRCAGEGPYFALSKAALGNQTAMFEKAQTMGEAKFNGILQSPPEQRFVLLANELELVDFFKQRGVSEDQANACLADPKKVEELSKGTSAANEQFNIQGTPTFVLNGSVVEGTTWPFIETKLKEAGAR